jgi:hypothetical protein
MRTHLVMTAAARQSHGGPGLRRRAAAYAADSRCRRVRWRGCAREISSRYDVPDARWTRRIKKRSCGSVVSRKRPSALQIAGVRRVLWKDCRACGSQIDRGRARAGVCLSSLNVLIACVRLQPTVARWMFWRFEIMRGAGSGRGAEKPANTKPRVRHRLTAGRGIARGLCFYYNAAVS